MKKARSKKILCEECKVPIRPGLNHNETLTCGHLVCGACFAKREYPWDDKIYVTDCPLCVQERKKNQPSAASARRSK